MDLLGVGPLELGLILLVAFLIIGPKDMAKTGKSLGKLLRAINQSESWNAVRTMGEELKNLPTKLMREAAIEDYLEENPDKTIAPPTTREEASNSSDSEALEAGLKAWTTPPEAEEESE